MTTLTRDQACDLMYALDLSFEDVRTEYSGRAMYGKDCVGFVINREAELLVALAFAQVFGVDDAWDFMRDSRTDSMGYSTIVYFPRVQLDEEAKEFFQAQTEGDEDEDE